MGMAKYDHQPTLKTPKPIIAKFETLDYVANSF